MDTATDMVGKTRRHNVFLVGIISTLVSYNLSAADVKMSPFVESGITFTDNVDLTSSNKQSSEILTLTAGIDVSVDGNDGNLLLAYQANQLAYSHDSNENELYNQLTFSADKGLFNTGFAVDAVASIDNVARSILDDASNDIYTGETVETKSFDTGLSYQSNPAGIVDLYSRLSAGMYAYDDGEGDYSAYNAVVDFTEGERVKDYFWQLNYSGTRNIGKESSTRSSLQTLDQELGIQRGKGLSPFVRSYYEKYTSEASDETTEFSSWGIGLRYYIHDDSYVEFSRDFALDDESDDYWQGAVHLNPNQRTSLDFEYTNRFYGDAYEFNLSHRSRRLTNEISYTEEVKNYDRDIFIDGESIEELTLERQLAWTSTLNLRRSTFSVEINGGKTTPINESSTNSDTLRYGSSIELSHNLTRKMSISSSFTYDYYQFDQDVSNPQKDYYRTWDLGLSRQFARDFSMDVTLTHQDKSSSEDDGYKENKIDLSVRKTF
ncbi:TIGR03016 family PEP-CTERM system-associated outer membrane protein [Vibrio sp. TH_r3]|uniref:TIGR03016 family PEP-CTERM system-associated outer membrane protein n=1 Tax=Vibrio sp. TH_r3 TaxID=3082084 RepID=UPI0029556A4C|nr:TIGR03016 family PEP-CTERM system-associated outer membrane protein [Vibrio sp. TH_r3]MDV7102890.1 TIGR03016 family PEP-CTERM system-associated outer membrane protein [Vibrio sp. TH_r3]